MKKRVLVNVLALMMIIGGAARLEATSLLILTPHCCEGKVFGPTCCGFGGCEAGWISCKAW